MKKILVVIVIFSTLVACSRSKEHKKLESESEVQAQVLIEREREAFNATHMIDYNSEEKLAVRKRLHLEDRFIKPKIDVRLEVLSLDADISHEEIERSFFYRRTSVELCYANALVDDENLTGRVEIGLSIDDNAVLKVSKFDSTFQDDKLNQCLKTSADRWSIHRSSRLPKADLVIALVFSADPPPSIEEILGKPLEPSDAEAHDGHAH